MIFLLISNDHVVENDRVNNFASGPDLDPSADTALWNVALIAYLNVLLHGAVEADLLDDAGEALVVGLLGSLVFLDLPPVLDQKILRSGRMLPEETDWLVLESKGVLVG